MRKRRYKDPKLCYEPDCRRVKKARRLCVKHYAQHQRQGTLDNYPTKQQLVEPCQHTCDTHEPSRACYLSHRCRCEQCRDAARTYNRRRIAQQVLAQPLFIPAQPVLEHFEEQLQRSGLSLRAAAKQIGVGHSALSDLRLQRVKKIRPHIARAVLDWQPPVPCEDCGDGTEAYAGGRWCLNCLNKKRRQHAA